MRPIPLQRTAATSKRGYRRREAAMLLRGLPSETRLSDTGTRPAGTLKPRWVNGGRIKVTCQ